MRALAALVVVLSLSRTAVAEEFYPKDTETYLLNYAALAKDPATAYLLSMAPGFGAGHFYAGQTLRGVIMALGEAIGIGLVLLAPHIGEPGDTAQDVLLISGAVLFSGFKIADLYFAPDSVEIHNKRLAKSLKIKPLISDGGGPGRGHAYGVSLGAPWAF